MARLSIFLNGVEIKSIELQEPDEYIAGRDEVCQIVLTEDAISRRHFKIYFNGTQWIIEKLSKFGKIFYNNEQVQSTPLREIDSFQIPPYSFSFDLEQKLQGTSSAAAPVQSTKTGIQAVSSETEVLESPQQGDQFEFDSPVESSIDKTQAGYTAIGQSNDYLPYIRVITDKGEEDLLRLEGESWRFGRSKKCEVPFDNPSASRLHFEISKRRDGYYIEDMKSSKGTALNGTLLPGNEPVPLGSGDLIEVGGHKFYFEIRDSQFENRLVEIPRELMEAPPVEQEIVPYESHLPQEQQIGPIYFPAPESHRPRRRTAGKNPMISAIIAIGIVAVFWKLNQQPQKDEEVSNKVESKEFSSSDPKVIFNRMTKEQQEYIVKTYNLGVNLYTRGKYETALREFQKLHELIQSYQNSKSLEAYCKEAIDVAADRTRIEQDQKKQKELKDKIARMISSCDKLAKSGANRQALEQCFAPALELDPDNQVAKDDIQAAEMREHRAKEQASAKEDELERVKNREKLYKKAQQLEQKGELYDAMDAYEKHMNASGPDPQNLKEKSQRSIANIKNEINTKINKYISEAESLYSSANVKDAVLSLNKALKWDPEYPKALELKDKYTSELYKKMKLIYTDSVLEEGHGNLEIARQKWQQILDADVPTGEYYNKAKTKMNKYGGM